MTNQILLQKTTARNGHPLHVQLTCPMRTFTTGLILPAGTVGRVIEFNRLTNRLMVDFGLANYVQSLDPNSGVFEFVRGAK